MGPTGVPNDPDLPAGGGQPTPVEPLIAGTFALYGRDDGALVLVTAIPDADGVDQVARKIIPAMVVRMIQGSGGGILGRRARAAIAAATADDEAS